MAAVSQVGPETLGGFMGLYPIAPYYSVMPGPGIGPMLSANSSAVPLSTLPSGVAASGTPGALGGRTVNGMHLAIGLAVSFVVGILILQYVHWR